MPGLRQRLKGLLLLHKIRASSLEIFWLVFFIMGQTLGVDSAIQARRLLISSSQAALFLPPNEYTKRHNRVGQYIHWKICNHYDIETPDKWYEHKPLPVVDTPKVTILWDFPIRTDRTIQANRPDIVIKHKQSKTCQFIDMSVPSFCYRV